MPLLLHTHKIAYFDTPKVASSSIKLALHKLDTGASLDDMPDVENAIHWQYPTHRLKGAAAAAAPQGYWRFAVVRDPVKRLLSAYSNRIVHRRDQTRGRFARSPILRTAPSSPAAGTTPPCDFGTRRRTNLREHSKGTPAKCGRSPSRHRGIFWRRPGKIASCACGIGPPADPPGRGTPPAAASSAWRSARTARRSPSAGSINKSTSGMCPTRKRSAASSGIPNTSTPSPSAATANASRPAGKTGRSCSGRRRDRSRFKH